MIYSKLNIPHKLKESQANRVTLLRRRFSEYQLEISREASGRLRGWVIAHETREVRLKGLPVYLTLQRATQLLEQSYLKLHKETIEILPKGVGGGMNYSRPSSDIESEETEMNKEGILPVLKPSESDINLLVEAISDEQEREHIRKAVKILCENDPEKKKLDLENKFIFSQYTKINNAGAQALAAALQVNQSIQSLNLHGNQIGDAGARALGAALQVNQTIQSLNLGYNLIRDTGAQALGKALQVNHTLQMLNLFDNQIGNEGTQTLGAALEVNQSIQSLDLYKNRIGDAGAQALGTALQVNQTLQELYLSDNSIGALGAEALGNALKVNQSIQMLTLNNNQIGNAGTQAIAAALQVNHTLQWLGINEDLIGDEGIITKKRIDTLLQGNKQITILFQQQIIQVQNFLQSHQNEEGILLQNLPQLKELLQKWHTDSKNIIHSLEEILIESRRTNLNDKYREKMEGIITDLTNRLHDLWLEPFERKVAALSNQYVMGKEFSEERNADLGYALYETWLTFLGSDCPNWVEDHIQSLIPFGVLLDIAESGEKKDVTDLTDAHLLFERVLSFKNESKDSLCSLTIQS